MLDAVDAVRFCGFDAVEFADTGGVPFIACDDVDSASSRSSSPTCGNGEDDKLRGVTDCAHLRTRDGLRRTSRPLAGLDDRESWLGSGLRVPIRRGSTAGALFNPMTVDPEADELLDFWVRSGPSEGVGDRKV